MPRKESKKNRGKEDLKASKPKRAVRKRAAKPKPIVKPEPEPKLTPVTLVNPAELLDGLPIGICLFDGEDRVSYCNDCFLAITGLQPNDILNKKLKPNLICGAAEKPDELQELFQKAKDSGRTVAASGLSIDRDQEGLKTWNISLIPLADEEKRYNGMGLLIEDITDRPLDIRDAELYRNFYEAALHSSGTQSMLQELVGVIKAYCRCAHVKIVIFNAGREGAFKAETGKRTGLWDKDQSVGPLTLQELFKQPADLLTPGGSIYIRDINELEGNLEGTLKELVVNAANSYGFTSLALVPVKIEDRICGLIQLASIKSPVRQEVVGIVENLSELLQVILERASLRTEMRRERESLLKQMHERSAHLEALSERLKQEASERKKAQEDLKVQKDLAVTLAGIDGMNEALRLCLESAIRISGMDSGGIYLLDPATGGWDLAYSIGLSENFIKEVSHYDQAEANAQLAAAGKTLLVRDIPDMKTKDLMIVEGIKGLCGIPILHQGQAVAFMNIASHVIEEISFPVRSSLEAVAAESGSAIGRLRDEAALEESRGLYGALFEGTADPILVYDEEGNYIDGNQAALDFLECGRDELLKMNVRNTLPPYLDEGWFNQYRKIWKTGGRMERDYYVWGKIKVMELTITPVRLGQRQVIVNVGKDITERKKLEQDLRKSEERYRTMLEQMDEVYFEVDLRGKYTFFNEALCRQLGYAREELMDIDWKVTVPPEDLNKTYDMYMEIYRTGQPRLWQPTVNIRKDGSLIYVEDSVYPVKNDAGQITGFRGISREVTERKKAEDALRYSEQKYRSILEDIDESYYEIDAKGNLIFFNDACTRRFGYSREELVGMNYKAFTRPEDVKEKVRIFTKVFQTGKPRFAQPMVNVRKDGSIAYVEDSIFPLLNEKGEIIGCRGIGRDVTERRRWETALKESEEKFRRLFYESPVGAAITTVENFHFVLANQAMCDILGYTAEELTLLNFRDITHPDDLDRDVEQIQKLAAGEIEQYETDKRYIRKDGATVWGHLSVRLIRDASGQPLYYLPIIQDITAQRMAEVALRESESKYRSLVESGGAGIVTCDSNGYVNFINDTLCKLIGYSRNEVMGKPFLDFAHTDDQDEVGRLYMLAVEEKLRDVHFEVRVPHKDGRIIWFYVSPVALKIDGKMAGFSAILQDITELKWAEDKIERLNLILQAIRMVNQLIVREKELDHLLQLACDSLVETRGLRSACIVLLDESRNYVASAQAGLGEGYTGLEQELRMGKLPYCMGCALEQAEPVEITEKIPACTDCPLWPVDQGYPTIGTRLEYGNTVYGVLIVSAPEEIPFDLEEKELLAEVAGDISFAVHNLELELQKKQADEALKESEEHFRSLAEESPNMIFINAMGRNVYVNRKCEELTGYAREELLAEDFSFFRLIAPEHIEKLKENFARHARGEDIAPVEYVLLTETGDRLDVVLSTKLITYDNKPAILGVVTDVSNIKKIERALMETENKYRIIMEETSEAYLEMDFRGYFTFVNDAACQHLGYTREELIGMSYKVITRPQDIHNRVAIWAEVYRTGIPRHLVEFINVRKDGSLYYTEISIFPLHNEKGEIVGLRSVALDITRRKEAEDELRMSEERYRTILEDIDESYVETDLKGNVTFFNNAVLKKLGYTREEFSGINYKMYTPPDQIRVKARVYSEVVSTGMPVYWHPFRNLAKDGTLRYSESSIFPLRNEKGEIVGIRTITRDVTEKEQALHALINSEAKYRSLVESGGAGIATTDLEGNLDFVNDTLCSLLGYTKEELMGKPFVAFIREEDRQAIIDAFVAAVQGERHGAHLEFRLMHKDGHEIWVYTNPTELSVDNEVVGFSAIIHDISERKRAEETIRQNEEKYRTILEDIEEHYAEADQRGSFTFVNDALCRYFGYSREEMLNLSYKVYTPPEDIRHRVAIFSEVYRTGQPVYWQLFRDIIRDGSIRYTEISIFPRRNEKGEIIGLKTIGRDVTERRKAEEQLQKSEERYRLLADNALDVIFTTDLKGKINYISPSMSHLTGLTPREIMSFQGEALDIERLFGMSSTDAEKLRRAWEAVVANPAKTQLLEFEFKHRDGFRSWAELKMSVMQDKDGNMTGVQGVMRDISQQKKMTERLVSADRLASLGEMAAGLAHEVNNPLTAVMGFAYLLMQNPDIPAETKGDVEAIYREGKRAADVIRSFLIFARGQKPEKQAIYLNDIIHGVLRLRSSQLEKENIKVILNLAEDLPAIQGDISQMQQVFLNIILNAEYFMYQAHRKGALAISTQSADGLIKVAIADDGPGIAPDKLSRVFDPFFTTKEVGEGTGLGLSICHGTIKEHGGNIYVDSEAGQGATFTIELPVSR